MRALGSMLMTLKAKVRGGRLVLNEPTDLPEGAEVELTAVLDDDLGPEERQALEASLSRSAAQLARNDLAVESDHRAVGVELVEPRGDVLDPVVMASEHVVHGLRRRRRVAPGEVAADLGPHLVLVRGRGAARGQVLGHPMCL